MFVELLPLLRKSRFVEAPWLREPLFVWVIPFLKSELTSQTSCLFGRKKSFKQPEGSLQAKQVAFSEEKKSFRQPKESWQAKQVAFAGEKRVSGNLKEAYKSIRLPFWEKKVFQAT